MKKVINKKFVLNLKKILFENLNIKIISFIFGISLFIFINLSQREEKILISKLNIIGLKEHLVIANDIPEQIKITVKDKKRVIDKIVSEDFNIRLDLSNIDETTDYKAKILWDVPKEMQSYFNPIFFSQVQIVPSEINLDIEQIVEKNIPIRINQTGKLMEGYIITKKVLDISEVRVQGPEKILNKIKFIDTERINIEGEKESFKRTVNLISPNKFIKFIGKSKVDVYFEIISNYETLTFFFDNISFHNLKPNLKIKNDNFDIILKVKGSKENLNKLSKSNIILSVDCSKIYYAGQYLLRIDINLPRNIYLESIKPDIIKLNVVEIEK